METFKDQGVHTVIGIVGSRLTEETEEHFRIGTKNVVENRNEGRCSGVTPEGGVVYPSIPRGMFRIRKVPDSENWRG
ncbi:hypothetical protein R1flu_026159 [Riccia fluitans]|uniref:Uncharacterized protein n=1 Tax=Riccia fluitans TaxID=41844 RepID=A0ABD1XI60_9MARC